MAQLNRNANYIFTIDGNTTWERLRVIRNFLADRKNAEKIAVLNLEKLKRQEEMLNSGDLDIDKEFEIREALILKDELLDNLEYCKQELEFLKEMESKLAIEAEQTRLPGKTDKEMYEINYFDELATIHILDVKSQLLAHGAISSDTMRTLIRNPYSLSKIIELGILHSDVKKEISTLMDSMNILNDTILIEQK